MEKKYFFNPSKEVIDAFNRALAKSDINADFQILLNRDRKFGQPNSIHQSYPTDVAEHIAKNGVFTRSQIEKMLDEIKENPTSNLFRKRLENQFDEVYRANVIGDISQIDLFMAYSDQNHKGPAGMRILKGRDKIPQMSHTFRSAQPVITKEEMAFATENMKQKIRELSTSFRTDMTFSGHPSANVGIDPFLGLFPSVIKPATCCSDHIPANENAERIVETHHGKNFIGYKLNHRVNVGTIGNLDLDDQYTQFVRSHLCDLDSFLPEPPEPRKMSDLLTRKQMGILDKNTFKKKSHKRTY